MEAKNTSSRKYGEFQSTCPRERKVRKLRRLAVQTVSKILYKNTLPVTDLCTFTPNGQNGSITVLFPCKNYF